ncbi:DUF3054 domain-containing protein [Corynebacterium canis]|uniref:DUF3054 domain-containing protein n=1 Tax=Corynebacterium canis TaxID=679663 RepID=A0A5C5UM22_9CORY|nr:DUF3054 domain-containing protein [Corynebacterium canis]TWT26633.1 DUF3054 domain-containing protein [Corynebacterium canis]WJY76418.1 hypothetical protein CCANI_13065 [Corynebacterium canis]
MTLALDLLAIAIFGLLARAAHQTPDMPFTFLGWLDTTWPFALGVLLAHALLRVASLRRAVVVWLTTVIVGLGIWGIRHQAFPHWSFIIVASSMSALLLFGWRGIAKLMRRAK